MPWPKGQPRKTVVSAESQEERPLTPREEWLALREYDRRVTAGLDAQAVSITEKVTALLRDEYGEDVTARLMLDIAPILKDPYRERRRRPVRAVISAA